MSGMPGVLVMEFIGPQGGPVLLFKNHLGLTGKGSRSLLKADFPGSAKLGLRCQGSKGHYSESLGYFQYRFINTFCAGYSNQFSGDSREPFFMTYAVATVRGWIVVGSCPR
jgi:hypothetical protein